VSDAPITDLADSYSKARRLLEHRRDMLMDEASAIYVAPNGQREAMGMMRGYGVAIRYLRDAEGARRALAEKATKATYTGTTRAT
jgi:hypothetical protein